MRYLFAVALAAASTFAHSANFVSLHQSALKIALPPPAGSYNYTFDTKIGFKQQYAPTGVSGCAIGFGTGGCAFPGGGSLGLPEFTGYQLQSSEFKVFIPAGARTFMFTGYAPQGALAAFAVRYGSQPTRMAALSGAEYQTVMKGEKIDTTFARHVNDGAEQIVVHDGGGTVRFVGGQLDANKSSTNQGKWLYIRQIQGTPLYDVQGGIDVDMPKYAAGYAQIKWNTSAYPDPMDEPTGVVTPTPGTPVTPVTPVPGTPTVVSLGTAVVSAPNEPLKLDVTLTQSAAEVAANPTASVWFAARIPANGFFVDNWYFRLERQWAQLAWTDTESVAYRSKVPNSALLKFTPTFDFTADQLKENNIVIFFGYKTGAGDFVSKGKIWPQ